MESFHSLTRFAGPLIQTSYQPMHVGSFPESTNLRDGLDTIAIGDDVFARELAVVLGSQIAVSALGQLAKDSL